MIDFRYHLVSLVSVFLALAVGIVLGAGPLKDSIGDTLAGQVSDLRKDRESLRAQRDTAQAGITHRDDFITALSPSILTGRLTGRSVLLVGLPGADSKTLDTLRDSLGDAGARVTGRILVADGWVDPDRRSAREELAAKLAPSLTGTPDATATGDAALAALLARAVLTDGPATTGTASVGAASVGAAVLDALDGGDLISTEGDVTGRAGEVIVVTAPVTEITGDVKASAAAGETAQDATATFVALASKLDAVGQGSVVLGPPSAATGTGVVAAVRSSAAVARAVSTVDTGGTSMGDLAGVLALDEQLEGTSGAYGFGDGASQPLPDVTAAGPTP